MPFADLASCRLYYEVAGEGPPLLLVMGLGTPSVGWHFQVPAFRERYRVIAFDNRGSGRSACPPGPYDTGAMADDAVALLDALGVGRAHVCGISMGGMIAQEIAVRHPGHAGALVLASTYAAWPRDIEGILAGGEGLLASGDPLAMHRFLMELAFTPDFIVANAALLLQLFAEAMPEGPNMRGLIAQIAAVVSHDARAALGNVTAPTLVITGTEDRLIPPACSREIARLVPGARLETIEGGSHAVNFERPEEWNRRVLEFLAAHDGLLDGRR